MKSRKKPVCICMIQLQELGAQAKCCRDSGVWLRPPLLCVFVHEVTGGSGRQRLGGEAPRPHLRGLCNECLFVRRSQYQHLGWARRARVPCAASWADVATGQTVSEPKGSHRAGYSLSACARACAVS